MSENLNVKWPMDLGAPQGSLEAKQPRPENLGQDVVDPSRYYDRAYMEKEWHMLWPKVWLLA